MPTDPAVDVRCPACARLLARRLSGQVEVVIADRMTILLTAGELGCGRCGSVLVVRAGVVETVRMAGTETPAERLL